MFKKQIFNLLKIILPLFLGVYLIWYFFSSMSEDVKSQFYKAIREANYLWIIASLLVGFVAYLSRAYRWKYTLEPIGYSTKFWNRYHAIMIGYIVNLTIPRAGEASRSAMLYRSDGVPFSNSFGTIIAERAVDFVVLVSIACFTAFIGYNDFFEIKDKIQHNFSGTKANSSSILKPILLTVFAVGIIVLTYLAVKKPVLRNKLISFVKNVFQGLFSIFKSKQPLSYIAHTILIWFCYVLMFILPFYSLQETSAIPFKGMMIGFIAGSLGIVFTNGGIGVYPLLVGLVVTFYIKGDYPENAQGIGNALGIIVWVSQTLLMIILGLISLMLLPKNYTKEDDKTGTHSIEDSIN